MNFKELKEAMGEERLKDINGRRDYILELMDKFGAPCVGICSTVYGDDWCRGCGRSFQEVIDWNTYSDEEKGKLKERYEVIREGFEDDI